MKSISKGTTGRDLKVSQNLLEPKGLYATLSPPFNQQSHASAHWGFRLTIDTVNALNACLYDNSLRQSHRLLLIPRPWK